MGIRVRLCSDWCLREADGESDYPQTAVSCIVRTQYPYFAQRYAGITGFYCIGPTTREIKSARTVLIKAMIFSFYPYRSGCVFYCSRIARKAEAVRDGSPRSINKSAMCPAMWRLTFSGGGRSVRLSANGCQPHRPNTALLFCAAGYRPGLLRTFREHDLNFYIAIFL